MIGAIRVAEQVFTDEHLKTSQPKDKGLRRAAKASGVAVGTMVKAFAVQEFAPDFGQAVSNSATAGSRRCTGRRTPSRPNWTVINGLSEG